MSEVYSFNEDMFHGENLAEMSLLKQIITDINNQPTIEAIPIEWIEKWEEEQTGGEYTFELITGLLEDWRKENERSENDDEL